MKIIAIAAVKGGVGKTTTTVNLATALAQNCGKRVLVVDANLQAPNVGLHLGVSKTGQGLEKVVQDKCHITEAIYNHAYGFDILLPNIPCTAKLTSLRERLNTLPYDFILLDTAPTLAKEFEDATQNADAVILVSTQDIPTLAVTQKSIKHLQQRNKHILGIICNKVPRKVALTTKQVEQVLGLPILTTIKESQQMQKSLAKVTPIVQDAPHAQAARAYIACAKFLCEQNYVQPSWIKCAWYNMCEAIQNKKKYNQTQNF